MKSTTSLIILTILLFVSISKVETNEQIRQLITGYFGTVINNDWKLNDECFGEQFDEDVKNIIDDINNLNLSKIVSDLITLQTSINKNCPLNDFNKVNIDALNALLSRQLFRNLDNNAQEILILIRDLLINKDNESLFEIGQFLGKLTNLVIYNKNNNLRGNNLVFINIDEPMEAADNLIEGLFTGIAKDPSNNKCNRDIFAYKSTIKLAIYNVIEAIQKKSGYFGAFLQVYSAFSRIPKIPSCHFDQLGDKFIRIANKSGITDLSKNILLNIPKLTTILSNGIAAGIKQDFFNLGISIAQGFSIVLQFNTE
jgi:hypothetical protein